MRSTGDAEATSHLGRRERAVRAGVTGDQRLERMGDRLGERQRQAERHVAAERVAVAGRVLGGDEPLLAAQLDLDRPASCAPARRAMHRRALAAQIDLGNGEVADLAQHVVQLVGTARPAAVGQALQLQLDVGEHARVEQLAQLLGAEQIAQQVAVERQRRRPALGQRRVALVHVRGDPVEQQALRERRRLRRVDADDTHRPAAQLAEHLAQRRQVEHVLQALARRLQQDRERRVLRRHGQQVGGPLALLPQRRAPIGATPRQQQGTRRALAEARREQRRLRQRADHQFVDVVGVDDEVGERHVVGCLRQAQHDAVVAPHRLDRHVVALDQPTLDGHRPRRVHRRAERGEDAHPPVADLVAEPLDHDGAIVGHDAGGLGLLVEVHHHVVGGEPVEAVVVHQSLRPRPARLECPHLALERAERPAELQRPTGSIAVPERHLARLARRRRDDDTLERDVLDAPRAGPEQERLARPALVDHLLVELADPGAVGQEHAEQPAVGDGAAAGDGQPLRAVAGAQRAAVRSHTIRGRSSLNSSLGYRPDSRSSTLCNRSSLSSAKLAQRRTSAATDSTVHSGCDGHVGDDLLGEHVERVAQEAGGLDLAVDHALGDHRGLEQVAAVLRVQRAPAGLADRVPGAPDALHAPRHRARRLDLDDEVDGTHVDAQLERAGGDDAAQQAALQLVFDDDPLLAGQRAVVCLDQLVAGELVEVGGQSFGLAPGVAEDDGAAMGEHLGEDRGVDALPDVAHLLDRHDDVDLHLLAHAGVDDGDRLGDCRRPVPAEEVGHLLQRALRGRQADALRRAGRDRLQPLERQHQVGPALGGGHRVDLVDDHGVDVDQRVGGRRGEHEVQALGRGDEQIDRVTDQQLSVTWRCVAGAHRHGRLVNGTPSRSAARPMPISGARRFFSTSKARARSGEMYSTRVRRLGSAGSVVHSRSIEARNAVSVLPLPVGAQTSVWPPPRMAGQPSICGVVGSGNDAANQARTAGENASSTAMVGHDVRLRQGCHTVAAVPAEQRRLAVEKRPIELYDP